MSETTDTGVENLVVFMDSVGRTLFGEVDPAKSDADWLYVYNPVVVHVQPNPQTGQMAIQLFPVFFREFLADKNTKILWRYNRKSIVETEGKVVFDFRLYMNYKNIYSDAPQGMMAQQRPPEQEVIKLFDDEEKK